MSVKNITVAKVGATIEVLVANSVKPNISECYALTAIKSVVPTYNLNIGRNGIDTPTTYPFKDQLEITINFHNEHANPPINFDIQTVTNQAGWTHDVPGLTQAKTDICGWMTSVAPGGAAGPSATEATLNAVLTAIQNHQDFEIKLVRDTGNGDKVVCERATYDEGTGTYSYSYVDVGGAAYVVVGPLEYLDPDATLNLLLTELTTLNAKDFATETTLGSLNTKFVAQNRTAGAQRFTTLSGGTAGGERSIAFFNAHASVNATVAGMVLKPGESISFDAGGEGDTLSSITIVVAAGDLIVTSVI